MDMKHFQSKEYGFAALWIVFTLILVHTQMPYWLMFLCFVLLCFGISRFVGKK